MCLLKNFYDNEQGIVALTLTILFPLIIILLALSLDGSNMFLKQARLSDALREASLGADLLHGQNEKRNYIQNYFKAYFKKGVDFSNITMTEETISNTVNTNTSDTKSQTSADLGNRRIVTTKADISFSSWFSKILGNTDLKVSSKVSIEPVKRVHINADYLFAMDFSLSMTNNGFATRYQNIAFCKPTSPDYDPLVCQKLQTASNRAEVMQAIVAKIINIVNSKPNSSRFGFLPFSAGSQIKKDFTFHTIPLRGERPVETQRKANYFALQVSLKDEFELSDYDFWSGVLDANNARAGGFVGHRIFTNEPYASHEEVENAKRLFNTFTRRFQNIISYDVEDRLYDVIDYEKTLQNMFNPDKAFIFRFFIPGVDTNVGILEARLNGIAYDHYGAAKTRLVNSSLNLNFPFFETSFTQLTNPFSIPVLGQRIRNVEGGELTLVSSALLRGAALLSKGINKERVLFVITDGVDDEPYGRGNPISSARLRAMEERLFSLGLCERIRQGIQAQGGRARIFFINISSKTASKKTLKNYQACAGKNNAAIVNNIDEFLSVFKDFIFGSQSGLFTEK